MKRYLFLAAIAAALCSFASCNKSFEPEILGQREEEVEFIQSTVEITVDDQVGLSEVGITILDADGIQIKPATLTSDEWAEGPISISLISTKAPMYIDSAAGERVHLRNTATKASASTATYTGTLRITKKG